MKMDTVSTFMQRSSLAVLLGGGVYALNMAIWHPVHEFSTAGTPLAIITPLGHAIHHAPELPAYALLAVGLWGLARYQAGVLGWLGKLGLYLASLGFGLMSIGALGIVIFEGLLRIPVDALETVHPLLLVCLLGSLLYGPTLLKNRLLAPEGAWLIMSGALLFLALIFSGIIDLSWGYWVGKGALTLFSAGWTWLGQSFWLEVRGDNQAGPVVRRAVN
jgi:hypothetical protein